MDRRKFIIIFSLMIGGFLLFLGWLFFVPKADLKIVTEMPKKQTNDASPLSAISITFSRKLDSQEQKQTKIFSVPSSSGPQTWSPDGKTLLFKPDAPLIADQVYTITVVYPSKQYSWSFQTLSSEKLSIEDQMELQTQADKEFAEEEKKIFETFPWYSQLPILTDRYFLYFDIETKTFIGKLYLRGNQGLAETYKQEALKTLQSLKIDIAPYEIKWIEVLD